MKRIAKELFPWDVLCYFARNRVSDDVLRTICLFCEEFHHAEIFPTTWFKDVRFMVPGARETANTSVNLTPLQQLLWTERMIVEAGLCWVKLHGLKH